MMRSEYVFEMDFEGIEKERLANVMSSIGKYI